MARRKSSRGRVFYYPSSLPKMQNGGGTNQQNNEYATTLDLISTYKGYNPSAIKEMLNKIAWHETGMTLNPKQLQGNDPKKPGKGLYQFEKDSLTTAIQRAKNFYKSVGEPVPDWINNLNTTDATTLSASQQSSLAALDMVQRKNFPVRQALESDEGLVEAWAKGWQTKNDPAKKELFKEHLEIYKDKGIKTELPTVNSLNPLIFFDPRRTLPKFQNGSRIENGTDSNDTVYVEKDPATGLPKLKKGGNIQKKGYKYNSPYRNRRYIDIHSNKITMDDVPERLLVRTDTGEERILEPNSGEYYFPGANVVREIPLRDTPLYFSPSSTGLTKYEPGGGILSEPVSGDVPTTLLPEINITGFKDNSYSFTGLPTIAPESSKTGKKCSAKNCAEQGTTEFANIVGTTREEISPLVAADAWYRRSKVLSNPNNELIFEAKTADYDGYKNLPVKPEGDWWKDIDFQVGDFVDLSGKILGSWRNKSKQPKLDAPSKEGYSQSNFARHSGVIIGKTPEGIPIVRHNIDGILYDEPITDISKKYNYFPSAIYRVNDENLNKGKQQYSIKQQEKYENITNYLDESLDLPFTGTVTDDEGNTLKVDTKKVNKKLVEPYKEIRRDLVVNYGVSQERLDDIFKTLLAIGTQESNLGNMVDDKFISKAKVSVLDILADVPIGLINPLLTGFSSESVLKTAKGALNVKGQIENLLSDYKVAEVPTWKLDKEIALLEAQGVPNDEAIHQIFSQYGAPSKTDKVTDPSKGPFRQKEPSGRWLETMGKEYSTTEAMRKANWGKEWDDSNKNFIANAIGLYLDNYDQAKKLYGENESEEFLNQVATLAHNAPTKAFTKEYTDFYIKGIDNPDPAKYNAGYVNKVYNAKNSMFRQPKSSRENSEGTYRGFIDKSAESSNQQQNANTPLVDVPSYFSGSKINLTRYQKGGFLPKYQKGDKIPTYMLPEVEVQAFPNATPAQRAALSTGPGNPMYRNAKSQLMNNKRPGEFLKDFDNFNLLSSSEFDKLKNNILLPYLKFRAEETSIPGIIRTYNKVKKEGPVSLLKDIGNTLESIILDSTPFSNTVPSPNQDWSGLYSTLDAMDAIPYIGLVGKGFKRGASAGLRTFSKSFIPNLDDVGKQTFKPILNTKQLPGLPNAASSIDNVGKGKQSLKTAGPSILPFDNSDVIYRGELDDIDLETFFQNQVEPNIEKMIDLKIKRSKDPRGFKLLVDQEKEYLKKIGVKEDMLDKLAKDAANSRIKELEQIKSQKLWGPITRDNAYHIRSSNPMNEINDDFLRTYTNTPPSRIKKLSNADTPIDQITPKMSEFLDLRKEKAFKEHGIYPTLYDDRAIVFGKYHSSRKTIAHEMGHISQGNRILPIEERLRKAANPRSLDGTETLQLNDDLQASYNYFTKNWVTSKRKTIEPLPFAHETKQLLLDRGIIKNWFDEITEGTLKKAKKSFDEAPVGIYDPITNTFKSDVRMLGFTHPSRYKMLAKELNKIAPVAIPATISTGVLGSQYFSNPQEQVEYRNGGKLPKYLYGGGLPKAQDGLGLSNLYNKAKNLITESEELDYAKRLVNTLPQYLNPKTYSYSSKEGLDSIPNYNKYNSFGEAFKQAREDLGRGQTFLYNGKRYTTNKENEFPNDESEIVFNTMTKTLSPEQKNKAKEYYFKQGAPYLSLGADDTKFTILPNAQVSFSDFSNRAHVNPVGPYNKVYLERIDYDFLPDEISEYEKSTGKTFYDQDVNVLVDELAHIEQVRDKGTGPFFKHFLFDGLKGELQKKSPYDMEGAIEHSAHDVIGPKRLKEIMGYQAGGQLPKAEIMTDPATGLPKLKKGGKAWIQGAIKKPGALRATAKRAGAIKSDGTIKKSWLREQARGSGKTAQRARLALTLGKMK